MKKRPQIAVISAAFIITALLVAIISLSINPLKISRRIDNLNNISFESFKELTLIKQDYNKLLSIQKILVRNYDTWERANMEYQKLLDERTKQIKSWANVTHMPIATDISINYQKISKRNNVDYFIVNLTNKNNEAKTDFQLVVQTYDETWTITNNKYSDKVDFSPHQTRTFEFALDSKKVDAVKLAYYSEIQQDETVTFDFGEQEILQIEKD
ncbi:MAG: hypothetical protein SOS24_02055 [Clostridia bacterium]|nr:hypothetical protein [Clostridia bacterium]